MAYGGRITKIMKENSSQMLFAELGIPVIEKTKVIQWINSVPEKQWIWNAYRNCYLLPVMTKNGKIQEKDFTHSNLNIQNFIWAKMFLILSKNILKSMFSLGLKQQAVLP